ncbi:hypothetical protein PV325_013920 [Microctonus aethiopoides]|nr:hypothetical protein PV325_013920 [Microctonus aethiopoides]
MSVVSEPNSNLYVKSKLPSQRESKMFSYKLYPLLILVLISPCFENANAGAIKRSRRSFFHYLDCPKSGEYNSEQIKIIARLDKVCEDSCAETLRMDGDELEKLKQSVRTLRSYSVS